MLQEIQLKDIEVSFREFVENSVKGNEIIIMKDNKPIAKIIPFPKKLRRRLGTAKGQVIIREGFKDIPEGFEDYVLSLLCMGMIFHSCSSQILMSKTSSQQAVEREVQFFDSDIFDESLSSSLGSGGSEITAKIPDETVRITEKFPKRLDKWLYMVKTNKGAVRIEAEPASGAEKGMPGFIGDILTGIYDAIREMILYSPAKNYNATLYYEKRTGQVTRVVFTKK